MFVIHNVKIHYMYNYHYDIINNVNYILHRECLNVADGQDKDTNVNNRQK